MRNITRIKRSVRAISPVISVLLMIAIAVIAALVAYAWVMGYMGNQTGKTDNSIEIQSYSFDQNLTIYVQNTGQGLVNLKQDSSVYVNDVLYAILEADDVTKGNGALIPISAGKTVKVEVDYYNYKVGDKIKVVTFEGTWMEITGTNPPTGTPAPATKYTITPTAGAGGSISPDTPQQVVAGGSITFTITPLANYHVRDVEINDVSVGARTTYTFTNVQENQKIHAVFEADGAATSYEITPEAGTGGSINPSQKQTVAAGGSVTFNIAATQGYHIKDVQVDGVSIGTVTTKEFTNVQANHVIKAIFEQDTVNPTKYRITPLAGAGGSISPNTVQEVTQGGSVTFTAQANQGYHIKNWFVNGVSKGVLTTSFTSTNIQENQQIQVTFEADATQKYTVTFTQTGLDTSVGTATVLTVNGAAKTLDDLPYSIQVNEGGSVTYSYVGTVSAGEGKQFVMTNTPSPASPVTVTSAATVTAQYTTQYQVTFAVNTPDAGTTTPATGTNWYDQGALEISATANDGYEFNSWASSTGSITINSATSATINGAGTITANFDATTVTILDSEFEGQTWDQGWDEWINPPWFQTTDPDDSANYCVSSNGYWVNRGPFTSNQIDTSDATAIHISFRYRTSLPLDGSLVLYYTGLEDATSDYSPNPAFNTIQELTDTSNSWQTVSITLDSTTNSDAFSEYFRLRFESFITTQWVWGSGTIVEQVWVDDVVITVDNA